MRILLTNDDGIQAPGIAALWNELASIAEVSVVAPDSEKSATSQAITVHHPIRVDKYNINNSKVKAWRIGGTPTDCVKIAVEALMSEPPQIIISGINQGANMGTDVLYSGTVSAAIEGAMHGIPSIAVSLDSWNTANFLPAAKFTKKLALTLVNNTLPPHTLLNVNIPDLSEEQLGSTRITKLGVRQYENTFERRLDPRGRIYYWMGGSLAEVENEADTDVVAVKNGHISVTPVHFDLTNYGIMNLIQNWDI